jgi:hypothetical protein
VFRPVCRCTSFVHVSLLEARAVYLCRTHTLVRRVTWRGAAQEADVLCNRIAILCTGKLRCIGTQLRLKNRFGSGYKLSMSLASASDSALERVAAFVTTHVSPHAALTSRVGASVTFTLPRTGIDVASLFQVMEEHKAAIGVTETGLSQTSLEEVFVKVRLDGSACTRVVVLVLTSRLCRPWCPSGR